MWENDVKKTIVIISVSLAMACGAYAGFWFFYSQNFKKEVAQILSERQLTLTHDGICCKGFPWKLEAIVSNPTLKEEEYSASTEGYWLIGTRILEKKSWMEVSGKTTINSNIVIDGTIHLNASNPKRNLRVFSLMTVTDSLLARLVLLRNISFSAEDLSIAYNGDEPFFKLDQLSFDGSSDKDIEANPINGSIKLDLMGCEYIRNGLINLLPALKKNKFLDEYFAFGKSDFSFHARTQFCPKNEDGLPYRIDIDKCYGVNKYGTSDLSGMVEVSSFDQKGLSCKLVLNCEGSTTKAYHDLQVNVYKDLVEEMKAKGELKKYPKVEYLLTHHWDEIEALFPDYTTEQPVKSQFDLTFQTVKDGKNKKVEDWSCDLRKCHIQSASREFSLQGYAGFKNDTHEPFLDLKISDYKPIIQDLATYYNRWQSLLTSTGTVPAEEMPYVNATVVNRMTDFVRSFSIDEKPDDLHLTFKGKDMNEMLWTRVMLEMEQLVADITPELFPDKGNQLLPGASAR